VELVRNVSRWQYGYFDPDIVGPSAKGEGPWHTIDFGEMYVISSNILALSSMCVITTVDSVGTLTPDWL
jgi:hypothetical protein